MKNSITFRFLAFLSLPFLLASCNDDEKTIPESCDGIEWTHHGADNGQDEWVNLCQGYSACGGDAQSPINITNAVSNNSLDSLSFNYGTTTVEIENNGHTVEFVCEAGSTVSVGGTSYPLKQFHYHSHSEHQLDGEHLPLEVHFVHQASSDSDAIVVGAFFEQGAENELFAKFLADFPKQKGDPNFESTEEIELGTLLPSNKSFYHYKGSLTTPPCSEIVHWYVLKNRITASAAQLAQFKLILLADFREIQATNGRPIYSYDK
jgi:carbonic anhydrase